MSWDYGPREKRAWAAKLDAALYGFVRRIMEAAWR